MKKLNSLNARHLAKESVWVVFGQILSIAGFLMSINYMTSTLTSAQYGTLFLILSLNTALTQIFFGPLSQGIGRFFTIAVFENSSNRFLKKCLKLVLVITTIIIVLTITFLFLPLQHREISSLVIVGAVFAVLSNCNSIFNNIQNMSRNRKIVAFHTALDPFLKLSLAICIFSYSEKSATNAVIAYCVALIIILLSQLYFLLTRVVLKNNNTRDDNNTNWTLRIWQFSLPMGIWGIFTAVHQISDRWSLTYFGSLNDVAAYAIIFQLGAYPITIAIAIVTQLFLPVLFGSAGRAESNANFKVASELTVKLSILTLIISLFATAAAFLLHSHIFYILVAEEYQHVSSKLPLMVLATGIFSAGQVLALQVLTNLKTNEIMPIKIMTAIVGSLLHFAGAYFMGINGVLLGSIAFSILYSTLIYRKHTLMRAKL